MVWGLTHLTASDYRLDKTLKILRLLRFLECVEMGLGFKVLGFLATSHWFLKGLKVLKWLRGLECAGKGNCQYAWRFFLLSNIVHFPLGMPLLVLRTTFPPKGEPRCYGLCPPV